MRVQIVGPQICFEKEAFAEELAKKLNCKYVHIEVDKLIDKKKFSKMTDNGEAFLNFHELMFKRLKKMIENLPDNVVIDFSPIDIYVTVLANCSFIVRPDGLTDEQLEALNKRLFVFDGNVAELSRSFTWSIHLPARKSFEAFDGTLEQCALMTNGYIAKTGLKALAVSRDRTPDPIPCVEPVVEEMEKLELQQAESELSRLRNEKITFIN